MMRFNDKDSFKLWEDGENSFDLKLKNFKNIYKFIDKDSWKKFKNRVNRIYSKDWEFDVVNAGNEGVILRKDKDNLIKIISKSKKDINEILKRNASKNNFPKPTWASNKIDRFYNFKINYEISDKEIRFEYPNILMPTAKINYAFQAHSLIKQKSLKILIDDNKIENYAKYKINNTDRLFKTVFNDFGAAFIEYDNDEDYNQMFFSIIRDNYYFVKNFRHHNLRQKVRDKRRFSKPDTIKDKKFHIFYDFVSSGYKIEGPRRACELKELPKEGTWLFCCGHQNTMTRIWEKNSNKYLDLNNINEDKVVECNCKNLLNKIEGQMKKKYFELDLNLNNSFTSYKIKFNPKIIALLTTDGKRDISKSLESVESQIVKVDNIFIASEMPVKISRYEEFVNPYKKGLARNTMQALSRIRLKYPYDEVYICTLDDDDLWKRNYIKLVKEKIEEGYNFIGSDLDVFKSGKKIDTWKYSNNDVSVHNFLIGNPGLQGSNKAFKLRIALESGGMPKNINASTDRAFNVNLLLHPETRFGKINSPEVIFNKDDNRKRISNDPNRIYDLRMFYKHFWHLIDEGLVDKINNRHKKKHGFKEVISWR